MSVQVVESRSAAAGGRPPNETLGNARTDDIVIGLGVQTTGQFQTEGGIFVDGILVDADVRCSSLSVSRGAEFHGNVNAARIEVSGTLHGEAVATEEVILRSTAVVTGRVSAPYIVLHRGATISGELNTLERSRTPAKSATPVPFGKLRKKRSIGLLTVAFATGLLLFTGATVVWLAGDDRADQASSPQYEEAGPEASVARR